MEKTYAHINKDAWNKKTPIHIQSDFYNNEAFLKGENTLKSIELEMLGDIKGKSILHLQCHFGQDTISLARMGAQVTGVDLADKAIEQAREFAKKTQTEVEFICCNIYDLPQYLSKQYDIVFTSYGVIGWLPDVKKWADIIVQFLKPQGRFVFVEFHPVVWMFDDTFSQIKYDYFNTGEIVETFEGSYADRNAEIKYDTVSWNHSLSDILNSLIKAGIEIKSFDEFDYSVYDCFSNTIKVDIDKYRIKSIEKNIPMMYALEGIKK